MAAPTTFSLSALYRDLGLRDPQAIAAIPAGVVVPVLVMGSVQALSSQIIEARGVINSAQGDPGSGNWYGLSHQAIAPGGVVIERLWVANQYILNLSPTKPFVGTPRNPFTTGGKKVTSLFEDIFGANPFPMGSNSGGSNTPFTATWPQPGTQFDNIWIPPGWFFWVIQNTAIFTQWTFREIQEAQGAQ